jgi:hypothetical protein
MFGKKFKQIKSIIRILIGFSKLTNLFEGTNSNIFSVATGNITHFSFY